MTSHWKAVLGVVLIYIFGCFSGAFSISIFYHHKLLAFLDHPGVVLSAALERRLTGNLALDAKQKQQVHEYFLENLQQRKELQKQIQPQVQALNLQTIREVAAILRPDQTELFQLNIDKFRSHLGATAFNPAQANLFSSQVPPSAPATNSGTGQPPVGP
jgi:hypothetical protein